MPRRQWPGLPCEGLSSADVVPPVSCHCGPPLAAKLYPRSCAGSCALPKCFARRSAWSSAEPFACLLWQTSFWPPLRCSTYGECLQTRGPSNGGDTQAARDMRLVWRPELASPAASHAGPPDVDDGWLEAWLEPFFRSLLLLYFLSIARLLVTLLPMRAGQPRRNQVLVRSRRGLRGAPLALALFAGLCFLPSATAMHTSSSAPFAGPDIAPTVTSCRTSTLAAGAEPPLFASEDPSLFCSHDFRFEIAVLRFQRSAFQTSLIWDPGLSANYVCAAVRDDLVMCESDICIFPAIPQLDDKIVVLGEVATSALEAMQSRSSYR